MILYLRLPWQLICSTVYNLFSTKVLMCLFINFLQQLNRHNKVKSWKNLKIEWYFEYVKNPFKKTTICFVAYWKEHNILLKTFFLKVFYLITWIYCQISSWDQNKSISFIFIKNYDIFFKRNSLEDMICRDKILLNCTINLPSDGNF